MFFSFFVTVTTRLKWPQNKISMPPPFGTCLFYYQTSSLWPSIFTHFISAWSYKSDRPLGLCPTSKVKVISGSLWHGQDTRSLDSVVCNTVPVIPNALYCENCKNTHTHTHTNSKHCPSQCTSFSYNGLSVHLPFSSKKQPFPQAHQFVFQDISESKPQSYKQAHFNVLRILKLLKPWQVSLPELDSWLSTCCIPQQVQFKTDSSGSQAHKPGVIWTIQGAALVPCK